MGTATLAVIMVMGCLQLPAELQSAKIDGAEHKQLSMLPDYISSGSRLSGANQLLLQVRKSSI